MSEANADKLLRLKSMARGDACWDLSPNDQRAIRFALDEIDRLTRERNAYLAERQQMRAALPACLEENGPTLLEAVGRLSVELHAMRSSWRLAEADVDRLTRERDEAKAVLAQIRQSFVDYAAEKARKPCNS